MVKQLQILPQSESLCNFKVVSLILFDQEEEVEVWAVGRKKRGEGEAMDVANTSGTQSHVNTFKQPYSYTPNESHVYAKY